MQGRCTLCEFQARELRCTKLHSRQHYTLHMCPCQMFSPSRDTIYRHQKFGRCAGQHSRVYEVDKDSYNDFCKYMGWANPPRFGNCVPTQRGTKTSSNKLAIHKAAVNKPAVDSHQQPVISRKGGSFTPTLPAGYKIPKKKQAITTLTKLEEGEVISSDDETCHPTVASVICKPKRARTKEPTAELLRAIELLEDADQLERRAKKMRRVASCIHQRYHSNKPHSK